MKVKFNESIECLYCIECKELIELGEKYIVLKEDCLGEKITKQYHMDCVPAQEEDDINDLLELNSEINEDDVEDFG